jgi:hypothetical protein
MRQIRVMLLRSQQRHAFLTPSSGLRERPRSNRAHWQPTGSGGPHRKMTSPRPPARRSQRRCPAVRKAPWTAQDPLAAGDAALAGAACRTGPRTGFLRGCGAMDTAAAPRRRRRQRGPLRYAVGASRNREIRTSCAPQVGPCTRRANRLPVGPRRNRQESAPHRQAGPFRQPATSGARQGPDRLRTFSLCYSPACLHHRNGRTRPSSRTSDQRASTGYACCRLPRDRLLIWPSARRTRNPPQAKGGPSRGTG